MTMNKQRAFLGLAALLLMVTPLRKVFSEVEPGRSTEEHHKETAIVQLSPAEIEEFEIEIGVAGPGTIETSVSLPGEVRPNADRLAHIVPRYSGIVTEVRANIGDRVKKGQVLAIVESDESLSPFELHTLISGTVISKHITLGEAVARDRDSYVIADLATVWIDISVYQHDINRIKVGQEAHIYVGHELEEDSGKISYVTPIVNEATRTATARVVLPNPHGTWHPGMFVTARITLQRSDVPIVIPRTALQSMHGESVVFVETATGFMPQDITVGRSDESQLEVLSGLTAGQRYVTKGGFTLKAEMAKESFGDGHGH